MPKIEIATGPTLHYVRRGSGEPMLLIQGMSGNHLSWGEPFLSELEGEFDLVAYDHRGVGHSSAVTDPFTMAELADDAAALLDALDLPSAHVAGLSLGSTVAQELCLRHPDRVRSAQLHGTWGRSDEWFRRMIETLEEPVRRGDMAAFIRYALMWITSPTFLEEQRETVAAMEAEFLRAPPHPRGVLGHIHADKTHDALARLSRIRCPVLVTSGERDIQVPPRYGRAVADRIPKARFHLFEGPQASHLACLEMAEEFNRVTLDGLASLKP